MIDSHYQKSGIFIYLEFSENSKYKIKYIYDINIFINQEFIKFHYYNDVFIILFSKYIINFIYIKLYTVSLFMKFPIIIL